MESFLKYKCYEASFTELDFRKSDCFQEIPASKKTIFLKKWLFGRSACVENVHVLE